MHLKESFEEKQDRKPGSAVLWFVPTQLVALFTAWSIAAGANLFRVFLLGSLAMTMLIPLLISLEAGLTAVLIFEPFRGLLRRAQYIFLPYSDTEPIHLISPIVILVALIPVLFREKLDTFVLTPLAGFVSLLALICTIQIFNPGQGGLYVGLTGALFYLVPMAWFYFGQAADPAFIPRVMRMIVILGVIASFYGVYQLVAGYPWFEQYWIDNTDYYGSISVYNVQRALATFSSAEEWGRYIQIGGIISVGLAFSREEGKLRMLWVACALTLFAMLILTGQRTSIFGLFLGIGILFLTNARSFSAVFGRATVLSLFLILVVALAPVVDGDSASDLESGDKFQTMVTHTTKGTLDPAGEGSLYARFRTWRRIVTEEIPSNPFGVGLGAKTPAARRNNDNGKRGAIDNHFLSFAISAGVPASLVLLYILVMAMIFSIRGWQRNIPGSAKSIHWRIMIALMSTFILNNFFGTSFTIYSVAPLGWLMIGAISRDYQNLLNGAKDLR